MIPETACLYSTDNYPYNKKICGLYPLERLIFTLAKAGVEKFYLEINDEEQIFYNKSIQKYINKIPGIEILINQKPAKGEKYFRLPINLFTQLHYFETFDRYFKKKGNQFNPIINNDQYEIKDKNDINKGIALLKQRILDITEGYISKNYNKKISLFISSKLADTRVHPNTVTIVNFLIGILSAYLTYINYYWSIAFGGFLFQMISVFDGIDGEIAKFTFKTSKFGGFLDTFCDHVALVLYLIAASYLFNLNFGGIVSFFVIGFTILGISLMIFAVSSFMRYGKKTQSLKDYDIKFIVKLDPTDPKVKFIHKTRYLTKKEMYSMAFFAIALTGRIDLMIPAFSMVTVVGGIILLKINKQYLKEYV